MEVGTPGRLRPTSLSKLTAGFDAPTYPDSFAHVTLWSFFAQPCSYQSELEVIGGAGFLAGLVTAPIRTVSTGDGALESTFFLVRDFSVPTFGPGELVLRVRHLETGAVAEKRVSFTPTP